MTNDEARMTKECPNAEARTPHGFVIRHSSFFRHSSFSCRVSALKTETETFPDGLSKAYFFAMFNALSFQIVLNSPMVLYAKSLGASATILGVVAGMMPLLVIFQIPAAQYVARVGYKKFVYAGWGMRVLFIFVMAVVPLTW